MYQLTAEQQAIVDRVKEIADRDIRPHTQRVDAEGTYPEAAMGALGREGFWGLTIPEEYGGMGQGLRVMCAVLDEIAQRCASTAMCYKMHLAAMPAMRRRPINRSRACRRQQRVNISAPWPGVSSALAVISGRPSARKNETTGK